MWTHQVFDVSIPLLQTPGCHGNTLGGSGSRVTVEEKAGKKEEVSSPSLFCNLSAHCGQVCSWTYRWQKGVCWLQAKSRADSSSIVVNTEVVETYKEHKFCSFTDCAEPSRHTEWVAGYSRVSWLYTSVHKVCEADLVPVKENWLSLLELLWTPEWSSTKIYSHLNSTAASRKSNLLWCTRYRISICISTRNKCKIFISFYFIFLTTFVHLCRSDRSTLCDMLLRDTKRSAVTSLSQLVCWLPLLLWPSILVCSWPNDQLSILWGICFTHTSVSVKENP